MLSSNEMAKSESNSLLPPESGDLPHGTTQQVKMSPFLIAGMLRACGADYQQELS
jgi:hypothetical protein